MIEFFVVSFVAVILSLAMLARNRWVLRSRINLLYTDYEKYLMLPSYDEMVLKFWIWDIDKFLK